VRKGAQGSQQRRGGKQHHVFCQRLIKQGVVELQGGGERRLNGYKQKNVVGRINAVQVLVIFAAQIRNVALQAGYMLGQLLCAQLLAVRAVVALVGGERNLAVYHKVFSFGHIDNVVGAHVCAVFGFEVFLLAKVNVAR